MFGLEGLEGVLQEPGGLPWVHSLPRGLDPVLDIRRLVRFTQSSYTFSTNKVLLIRALILFIHRCSIYEAYIYCLFWGLLLFIKSFIAFNVSGPDPEGFDTSWKTLI